jgi:hypothetical protein
MDFLVLGNFILDKREMNMEDVDHDWRKEFTLD